MPLERVLEPEVMDTVEEAVDYNSMDHSAVNQLFVADLINFAQTTGKEITSVMDFGTGTALIPIELCQQHPTCRVVAIDMAEQMLKLARQNVSKANLSDRIELKKVDAKGTAFDDEFVPAVISNSIIHHIPEPIQGVQEMVRVLQAGGLIFVRDLMRPESGQAVEELVETYAGDENEHSKKMFDDSLRAALSLEEIRALVVQFGFEGTSVQATSDRHWTWAGVKPM